MSCSGGRCNVSCSCNGVVVRRLGVILDDSDSLTIYHWSSTAFETSAQRPSVIASRQLHSFDLWWCFDLLHMKASRGLPVAMVDLSSTPSCQSDHGTTAGDTAGCGGCADMCGRWSAWLVYVCHDLLVCAVYPVCLAYASRFLLLRSTC